MAIRRSNDSRRTAPATPASKTVATSTPAPAAAAPAPAAAAPQSRRPSTGTKETPAGQRARVSPEVRRGMIAESAYLRAERRGFVAGFEEEDWIAAEREVDALLTARLGAPQ